MPNEDSALDHYDMIPRIGAFEVSYKGIILFSKMMSGVWPHFQAVAKFVEELLKDVANGTSLNELKRKYTTNGQVKVMARPRGTATSGITTATSNGFAMEKPAQPVAAMEKKSQPVSSNLIGHETVILCGTKLKSPDEMFGHKESELKFPEGVNSALSRNITPKMFHDLCDKKDKENFSFC